MSQRSTKGQIWWWDLLGWWCNPQLKQPPENGKDLNLHVFTCTWNFNKPTIPRYFPNKLVCFNIQSVIFYKNWIVVLSNMWVFPKIMVPPNHPFRVFYYKPSIFGVPLFSETPVFQEWPPLHPAGSRHSCRYPWRSDPWPIQEGCVEQQKWQKIYRSLTGITDWL